MLLHHFYYRLYCGVPEEKL